MIPTTSAVLRSGRPRHLWKMCGGSRRQSLKPRWRKCRITFPAINFWVIGLRHNQTKTRAGLVLMSPFGTKLQVEPKTNEGGFWGEPGGGRASRRRGDGSAGPSHRNKTVRGATARGAGSD